MVTKVVSFPFSHVGLENYYLIHTDLVEYILTPDNASLLGLSNAYTAYVEAYERLNEIFKRNPAFIETLRIEDNVRALRGQLSRLNIELKGLVREEKASLGGSSDIARQVWFVAAPYLKFPSKMSYTILLSNASKLAVDLQTPALAPLVEELGLTSKVAKIDSLFHSTNALYLTRSNEAEFNRNLGTAAALRPVIDKTINFILYVLIPAALFNAANTATHQEMEEVVEQINAILDEARRKMLPGSGGDATLPGLPGGDGSDGSDDGGNGSGGSGSDDGSGNGGSGGSGDEEPGGSETPGGGDEGSGGPLDRNLLTDRADGAIEIIP
jgi:hypothetical protein